MSIGEAPSQERRARVLADQQALTPDQPVDYGGQGLSYTRGRKQRHENQKPIVAETVVLQPDVVQAQPSSNGPLGDASNKSSPASSPANPVSHMGGAKPQTSEAGTKGTAVTTGPPNRGMMGRNPREDRNAMSITGSTGTGADRGAKGRNASPGQATTTGPSNRGKMGKKGKDGNGSGGGGPGSGSRGGRD